MLVDCIDHVLIDLHWIFSPEASDPFVLLFLLIVSHNLTLDIGIRSIKEAGPLARSVISYFKENIC